jgi:myo-inositol 2-dehydrogenase/D-chiro-inositol 1-dehydrogenase
MKEFIECVQQDKTPSVTGIDGLVPVVIGHAAKKSLDENRPIKISEIS